MSGQNDNQLPLISILTNDSEKPFMPLLTCLSVNLYQGIVGFVNHERRNHRFQPSLVKFQRIKASEHLITKPNIEKKYFIFTDGELIRSFAPMALGRYVYPLTMEHVNGLRINEQTLIESYFQVDPVVS